MSQLVAHEDVELPTPRGPTPICSRRRKTGRERYLRKTEAPMPSRPTDTNCHDCCIVPLAWVVCRPGISFRKTRKRSGSSIRDRNPLKESRSSSGGSHGEGASRSRPPKYPGRPSKAPRKHPNGVRDVDCHLSEPLRRPHRYRRRQCHRLSRSGLPSWHLSEPRRRPCRYRRRQCHRLSRSGLPSRPCGGPTHECSDGDRAGLPAGGPIHLRRHRGLFAELRKP